MPFSKNADGTIVADPEVILESITDGFFSLDLAWQFTYVNRQAEIILDRHRSDLLGQTIWSIYPGLIGSELEALYRSCARDQVSGSTTAFYPDHARWYEAHVYPSGIGISVYFRNVTARIEADDKLRASENRFRMMADAIPQMVWIADQSGRAVFFNKQWAAYTGVPIESMAAEEVTECFVHEDDRAGTLASWNAALRSGHVLNMEHRLRSATGQYRWFLVRAEPEHDAATGAVLRWYGTSTDVHDRKLAEVRLQEADQRKDEFLAMLAHELRNPLAPISAAAVLLRMAPGDATRVQQTSEVITRQVRHMTSLIDDLMDVSRVTRGLVLIAQEILDVRRIVTDAVEQVRPLLDARQHRLELHMAPESALVLGDQKRLVQVISNLLNNAAKYTPEHGHITLRMALDHGQVSIEVADNGIGMAPELVHRAFDLFAQAERTADRSQGGLGIGLALVRSLVELHAGQVAVHSDGIGQGTTFTVHLPRAANPAGAAPLADHIVPAAAEKKLRLLVVDDNVDAAQMLGVLLQTIGHHVTIEHSSRQALEHARAELPDACLLDIGLPDMDGNELARQLRQTPQTRNTVLIAITGYGQDQERKAAAEAGFDHHFVKPVDTTALASLLATLIERRPGRGRRADDHPT